MKRAIIIHGWEGNPKEGWMPWLKAELEKRGWQVNTPLMPHRFRPKLEEWLKKLSEVVGTPNEETFFIGHSLGCYTFLKYIEQLSDNQKVGGGVMVAGFAGNLKHNIPILQKYYETGLDWPKIQAHTNKFVAIASERDDYVHIQSLHEFAEHLGAKTIVNNNWEHFSGVEGIKELPEALEAVLEIAED